MKDENKTKEQLILELEEMRKMLDEMRKHTNRFQKVKEKLSEQLIEYEKLSALGRLTASVAHEIRNPITVIGGLTRRLKKCVFPGTKQKEYLDLIMVEAKRLEDILREVLTFSSKTIFKREEHNINEVVDECLGMFEPVLKKYSIGIHKFFDNLPNTHIAKKQVMEAINNLISNAIDAMPNGGLLSVTTSKNYLHDKAYVVVKVTDTGMGIPEENIKMIFEPFFSTKVTKKETGLGLSITKKVLELHGGFITVDSKLGKGVTFNLFFPYRSKP